MTRSTVAELRVVAPPERSPAPAADRDGPPPDPVPKRMVKRCRRCGKHVPTLGGLVWWARRVSADLESAAEQVFRAWDEEADGDARQELLRSAHRGHGDGRSGATKLLADLKRLQAHDRACHPSARPPGGHGPGGG
jgi:hypothetical protein